MTDKTMAKKSFYALLANSRKAAAYMISEITHICRDMKPRSPGSTGEREAAEYMAGVLRDSCGCEETYVEPFKVHPASFYGYCQVTGILGCLSCGGFFLHPAVSIVFGSLSLLLFLFFFVLYKPVTDWLYPEKESVNVTALRRCTGEVKRRVFFNGHIDAAWEFTLNYHFGGVVFEIPNVATLVGTIFYVCLSICALCGLGGWTHTVALCALVFIPFFIAVSLTYNPRLIVDGANDNLTGCYMGISILREMENLGMKLENTEAGIILTGSEEAGLRGAKAWCKKHKDDYKDVPTFVISFDTIHDPRFLMANERDLNSTVAADRGLVEAFCKACEDTGVPYRKGRIPLFGGSTDSAAFTQGGFRSAAITGLSHKLENYYHTRRDTYDNLNEEGIGNCYKAAVRMLELIDRGYVQ